MSKKNSENRKFKVSELIIMVAFTVIYWFVAEYFLLVPINLRSVGFWIAILFNAGVLAGIAHIYRKIEEENEYYSYSNSYYHDYKKSEEKKSITVTQFLRIAFIVVSAICLVVLIIGGIFSSKITNAKKYANLIQVEEASFEDDFSQLDADNLIIVDQKTAQKLGDRQLAKFQNSTYFDVDDEYNLIEHNGTKIRISPLNFGGFFKANNAGSIPGYIYVNAKTQEADAVMFDTPMVYSPSAYWGKDLERHLHFAYPSYMLGKSFFEVDETNNPYWITSVKTPTIFLFGGKVEDRVLVTNAVTGEITEYAVENVPEWIDHVHGVSYVMNLLYDHYTYSGGFWNSIFGKTGVYNTAYAYRDSREEKEESAYTPFDGYNSLVDTNDCIMFYTGITPANNAETNIGFVLISPRDLTARFYAATGAEESSAQKAAEGLVSDLKYSASFPTIVNIDGEETYFMMLKDGAGLVQKYAFCNIENYSKVVEANTIDSAIAKYRAKLNNMSYVEMDNADNQEETTRNTETIEANVDGLETVVMGGYTYYYFTVDSDDYVYISSIQVSNLQPFKLTIGANVTITFYDSTEEGVRIVTELKF